MADVEMTDAPPVPAVKGKGASRADRPGGDPAAEGKKRFEVKKVSFEPSCYHWETAS